MTSLSPSPSPARGRHRSRSRTRTRSLSPRADISRSPDGRRRRHNSRSPARSPTPPRRNGRYRSRSRSWSRGHDRDRDSGRDVSPAKSTKIVVERLSKNINEEHLYEIFGQFGRIKDLDLPINRSFGTNRGTAYILYDYETDAEAAIAHMHEAQVDGATINVSIVLSRRKLSPAPPMARRGANIDPRVPFSGARGGPTGTSSGGSGGNVAGGSGRRRMSPGSRYAPRSDIYRPGSRSPSRSPGPPSRGGGSRYRSHSNDSYSSRSRSRSPAGARRRGGGRHDDHGMRRRSVSRSSFNSYGDRSRSRSRGRGHR